MCAIQTATPLHLPQEQRNIHHTEHSSEKTLQRALPVLHPYNPLCTPNRYEKKEHPEDLLTLIWATKLSKDKLQGLCLIQQGKVVNRFLSGVVNQQGTIGGVLN